MKTTNRTGKERPGGGRRQARTGAFAVLAGAAALAAAGLSQPATAGPFEDGERAYLQQDYKKAHKLLAPLARKGNAQAQYLLGRQYQFGQGVGKNKVLAYYWYRRAEKGGHVEAGLFRHLLVSKWKMTKTQVAQAEKLLAGKSASMAAGSTVKTSPAKTPVAAKNAGTDTRSNPAAKKLAKAQPKALAKAKAKAAAKVRAIVRRTTKHRARTKTATRKTRRAPYATAVIRPYPSNRPPGTGWRRAPSADDCPDCSGVYRRYDDDDDDVPVRPYPRRRWPGAAARRYLYQLPPWRRRAFIRRHRWRILNDPFYRRAWRAYRRYRWRRW